MENGIKNDGVLICMKVQQAVRTETKKIAQGVILLSVLMISVFLILGRFDYTVLLGAMLGSLAAVANFFFMAMTVQKIAENVHGVKKLSQEEREKLLPEQDPEDEDRDEDPLLPQEQADLQEQTIAAKARMQRSYGLRMAFMIVVGIIGLKVSIFHPIATLVPFLFPRIVIMIHSLLSSKKGA